MCVCIVHVLYICFLPLKFLSEDFQPRTREIHANQCADLAGPLHNHYATTYGLHRDSVLNTLEYFHVTEGLIPDIMHDCLEGSVQYGVKELLNHILCSEKILSVSAINDSIQSFPLIGSDAKNHQLPSQLQPWPQQTMLSDRLVRF